MQSGALRALEYDRIVDAVRRFAQTPPGAVRLSGLHPLDDVHEVGAALAATSETVRFLRTEHVGLQAPEELDAILASLAIEGGILEPQALVAFATFLVSVGQTCQTIRRARGSFPRLGAIAETAASFDHETADIRRKISPRTKSWTTRARSLRAFGIVCASSARGCAERSSPTCADATPRSTLQQQIVTDRNGRYVLVVRSEHRAAIPGIVHGSSGSGASLFLEPLSTVEINNDIVALEQQESEEVRRILLALADALRRRATDVQRTVDAAVEIDVLQARARFSLLVDGIQPSLAGDGRLELRAARHPLLIELRPSPSRERIRRCAAGEVSTGGSGDPSPSTCC